MAATYPLRIEAGATFRFEFEYTNDDDTPFDLADYDVKMQIRQTVESSLALEVIPTVDLETSRVSFEISAEDTSSLTAASYVYAVEMESIDNTIRLLEGGVKVSPEVVR